MVKWEKKLYSKIAFDRNVIFDFLTKYQAYHNWKLQGMNKLK